MTLPTICPARFLLVAVTACVAFSGCGGSPMIKVKGKVLKGGAPLAVGAREQLEVVFTPYAEGGNLSAMYTAEANDDGSFEVRGDEKKGILPGKYRISVQLMTGGGPFGRDKLKGKFGLANSPIVHEVSAENAQVEIDLAQYEKNE